MKKKNGVFTVITLFSAALCVLGLQGLNLAKENEIFITAHRGSSRSAPENTLPAIEQAIKEGADYIEVDVRKTKDGQLILLHDSDLERTTGYKKNVSDCSIEELSKVDAGSWFDEIYNGTGIPTLAAVLEFSKGKIKLNIDIKECKNDPNLGQEVASMVKEYDMKDSCMITSTNLSYLEDIEREDDSFQTGIILDTLDGDLEQYSKLDLISVMFYNINKEDVKIIHSMGMKLCVWTINDVELMKEAKDLNVDHIITDDPVQAKNIISY